MLNSGLKADKLAYIADNADARFLVTSRFKLETVKQATRNIASLFVVCTDANSAGKHASFIEWNQIFNESADPVNLPEPLIDQDLAALIYTSGSTGLPKGVMQPHAKCSVSPKASFNTLPTPNRMLFSMSSLWHSDTALYQVVMSVIFGGTVILEKSFIYLHDILKKIPQYHVTGFPLVPTILATLFKVQDISQHEFFPPALCHQRRRCFACNLCPEISFPLAHISIYPMYGLTECVRVCYLPPEHVDQRPDSVGFAIPNCRVLVEREDGSAALPDEVGQLVIEGTNVMPGYWKDPELTAKVFRPAVIPVKPGSIAAICSEKTRTDFSTLSAVLAT
jgi:acyl-CoA synthetase (AMP-forming)/AMP-acid ligase II